MNWNFLPHAPAVIIAGMPSPVLRLTDIAKVRLDTLSFFLMVMLLVILAVRWLWNSLGRDFSQLGQLTFAGAMGLTLLWSLLFVLVLEMISGARELMTPGAWEQSGATYRLRDPEEAPPPTQQMDARRKKLENLRMALLLEAVKNKGNYPESQAASHVSHDLWQQVAPPAIEFEYVPQSADNTLTPLVIERPVYDDSIQLVLLTDGSIRELDAEELAALLNAVQEVQYVR